MNNPASRSRNERTIITHSVLIGLTPLIPIPVVDDLTKAYFQRRMVTSLASARGVELSREDVDTLATDRGGRGCLVGCLSTVLVYPVKKIFRKVFYFLEWKRAVDLTSAAYHHGFLIDTLFSEWGAPASTGKSTAEVRDAIDAVCREAPIKPLERAIWGTFRQSKNLIVSGAGLLEQSFRKMTGRANEKRVAQAVESIDMEEARKLESVVDRLEHSVDEIPQSYFDNLKAKLTARLGRPVAKQL
jgi:hypothetical protein